MLVDLRHWVVSHHRQCLVTPWPLEAETMTSCRLILACVVLGIAQVSGLAAAQVPASSPGQATMAASSSGYRLGPEDVVEISVWREDALKREVLVRPDGGISYPLIGDVQAAGKTVDELRGEITKRLEKFVPDAAVSVTVLKAGSQRIYVLGKVTKSGEFPVGRNVDVLQALSMAGGLTQFADQNGIRILRRDGDRQVVLPFEYGRVVRGENLQQNILLRAGDVVVVP
jgi:polysaccharide export outer membrane protein